MSIGAQRADAQAIEGEAVESIILADEAGAPSQSAWGYEDEEPEPARSPRALAVLLVIAAILWMAASLWSIGRAGAPIDLATLPQTFGVLSGPLILLGLIWVLFGRTSRRESDRFTHSLRSMRRESAALEALLGQVATRIEDNHARLSSEAEKLMRLSDEASDRLGRVTFYLAKEGAVLDRKAQALETAAEAARIDLGVMIQDLPRAEAQARDLAGLLRETGLTAHEQAGALEGQVAALAARGREADENAGGAAQRLGAHLARIESSAASASERMNAAAANMSEAVDSALMRAAEAVDSTRGGIDEQSQALFAMIEQSRAAFERAGDDAGRSLRDRMGEIEARLATLAERIGAEDAASQVWAAKLANDLTRVDAQLAHLGDSGRGNSELIAASLAALGLEAANLDQALLVGADRASSLSAQTSELSEQLGSVTRQLRDELNDALEGVEAQAVRTSEATHRVMPDVTAINAAAGQTIALLAQSHADLSQQREAAEALTGIIGANVGETERTLQSLAAAIGEADDAAARLSGGSGAALVDALIQVREAAAHAAQRAREAIDAVIPQSAAALAEASRDAVAEAVEGEVNRQMGEVGAVAARAVEAARQASERLTQQLVGIGAAAAAVEAQIDEGRRQQEAQTSEAFSRRVALLIDSLNSTAIDVTKILSNDVTDEAWNAYLKGDRGVFTRRAVRLLDAAEAREVAQHYESEPEFRDQVNRYIHDFEAMLRRVLAERDASVLGVTLLSSDMGKLYVALAQAIDRLRS